MVFFLNVQCGHRPGADDPAIRDGRDQTGGADGWMPRFRGA